MSESKNRITDDPDFINCKRFDFSLKKLLERYPEGCPTRIIANALMLTEAEVEELYEGAIERLRKLMGVE
jgi:hypothetical protein